MAKYGSPSFKICLFDGRSILASAKEVNGPEVERITEETTNYGDDWPEHTPVGMRKATVSLSGWYDDDENAMNDAILNGQSVAQQVIMGLAGNAVGQSFIGVEGVWSAKYSRLASVGALHKANAALTISGAVSDGVILQEVEAKTADWNTEGADSVDSGASSANGGVAFMAVLAMSGFTGFVGKVRHSADDSTYADLVTFDNVTAGPASQRKTVSGTVERYLAFDGNVTGSGSITPFAGFARG